MDIVETSYATKAFSRAKFIRKAPFLATGFTVAPVIAYSVILQLLFYQTTMESDMATNIGSVATIGGVALTIANDQMDRITWAVGLPLRDRWIREECATVDKIAGAWGF